MAAVERHVGGGPRIPPLEASEQEVPEALDLSLGLGPHNSLLDEYWEDNPAFRSSGGSLYEPNG